MSSTINASSAGIVETADSSGTLQLQTGGQSALYIDTSQNITIPKNLTVQGTLTFSGGGGGAVTTVSGGSTGLTPSTPASGNVVLGGTLLYSSGGTGLTSTGSSGNLLVSTGSGWASQTPATTGLMTLAGTQTNSATNTFSGTNTFSSAINAPAINSSGSTLSFDIGTTQYVTINTIPILFPNTDNLVNLGSSGNRWTQVFAVNGTINTSDANEKQQVAPLTAAELAVSKALKGLIVTFKFNDAVAKKGANARIHTGVIAQQVEAAFTAQGLDANKYGLFCSDTWYQVNGKNYDENGQPYTATSPNAVAVTRLGVRYEELLAFIIAGL